MAFGSVNVVVENLWIRPDGSADGGRPASITAPDFLPDWMIRVEDWASIGLARDTLSVRFDPRCTGPATASGMIDAIRRIAARQPVRAVVLTYHDGEQPVCRRTGSTIEACRHILQVQEAAASLDTARYLLSQAGDTEVETTELRPSPRRLAALLPRTRAFLDSWREARGLPDLVRRLDGIGQYTSMFRLVDGDPRVLRLGGALMFCAAQAEGARLVDVIPSAQAAASRDRLVAAMRSGEPVMRRHRTSLYDIVALTVPLAQDGQVFAFTMSQPRNADSTETATPRTADVRAPARAAQPGAAPAVRKPALRRLGGRSGR